MTADKKMSIGFLLIFIAATFLYLFFCFYYDPLHIFSLPQTGEVYFDDNARQQNAAFIRHVDFDSVILGNSYTENTSAKEAGRKLGGHFFNLSMSGSNNYERSFILDDLFRRHTVKKIILLLTEDKMNQSWDQYPLDKWIYLYDTNPLNDFQVYGNSKFIKYVTSKIINRPAQWGQIVDLDRPYSWYQLPFHNSRFGGLENWAKNHSNSQIKPIIYDILPKMVAAEVPQITEPDSQEKKEIDDYLQKTIFEYVKKYPDTTFYCYYNPDSMVWHAIRLREGKFGKDCYFIKRTAELGDAFPNFRFFGFSTLPFTSDLAVYKDLCHYYENINSSILTWLRDDKYRITSKNVDRYLSELKEKAEHFDISNINNTLQHYLKEIER